MKFTARLAPILALLVSIDASNKLSVNLEAPWQSTGFELNLIESITSYNESLYVPTVLKVFGLSGAGEDDDSDDDSEHIDQQSSYEAAVKSLEPTIRNFVGFDLVNKIHSPRIQAHHEFYRKEVLPKFAETLVQKCSTDSFGRQLLTSPDDMLSSWVYSADNIYCSPEDLFALKTGKSEPFEILDFDRIIGENENAPMYVLYSTPDSREFPSMFNNLYQSAQSGKIRFIWRYIPEKAAKPETLSGYGVEMSLKNTDYLAVDDNDIKSTSGGAHSSHNSAWKLEKDFWKILASSSPPHVTKLNVENPGFQISSFILSNPFKNVTQYELLNLVSRDLPKLLPYITTTKNRKVAAKFLLQIAENEKTGVGKESYGLYVNGSPINKLELDLIKLIAKIKEELKIIEDLQDLGLSTDQAQFLVIKFALISAVKQSQFRSGNTIMGYNENRFRVYEHQFYKGSYKKKKGIVYVNDIEKDDNYQHYSSDREETYLMLLLQYNQIPPLRENVHDVIFALNFANKEQLRVFFTLSKVILDSGIPQQVGLLAVDSDDPQDAILAETFYFIADTTSPQEAMAFLYKYFEAKDEVEVELLLKSIIIPPEYEFKHETYKDTLKKFSITSASVIINGVIHELNSPTWQISMGKQLAQDISLLKHHIRSGAAHRKSLKSLLYENAKAERNLRITPLDPSEVIYKPIDGELISKSVAFKPLDKPEGDQASGSFWVIGNFQRSLIRNQLVEILKVMRKLQYALQVRIINTGLDLPILKQLRDNFQLEKLRTADIDMVIDVLQAETTDDPILSKNTTVLKFLERKQLPVHHDFLLLNSRYFRLSEIFKSKELGQLLEYEFNQRMSIFPDLVNAYPESFSYKLLNELNDHSHFDNFDWFDIFSSVTTKSFYPDETAFITDVNRFDFSPLNMELALDVTGGSDKPVSILLIADPMDEYSQKTISIVNAVKDLDFVSVKILLQPKTDSDESVKRFYRGVFPEALPRFKDGAFIQQNGVDFVNLPESDLFTVSLDSPAKWISVIEKSDVDLDNVKFDNLDVTEVKSSFTLKSILIEGHAIDVKHAKPPSTPLVLQISQHNDSRDTMVMSTRGYFQLQAAPGMWDLSVKSGLYSILSASHKFAINQSPLESARINIFDMGGKNVPVRLESSNRPVLNTRDDETINVFSIARGHLYERLLNIMMLSVKKHTSKRVKFWVLENFVSGQFKKTLPALAESAGFEFEYVTYKWPQFLRQQSEKQREVWGYKILFLDVLFPQDLHKVIFVDADQIVRSDLNELAQIDLNGAPYGFTPMCDSREEMEGFRFWKLGYWSQVLGDKFKYHISALFVVDLDRFRELRAGDKLRAHYQKLLSDPQSLLNLDQDLPNNMQGLLPIFSLPQEWLWCETWCASSELDRAKSIDLCNNPLTKESKLDQAKRLIPEWTSYDNEADKIKKSIKVPLEEDPKDNLEEDKDYGYEPEHDEL